MLCADHLSWCCVVCATEHVRRIVEEQSVIASSDKALLDMVADCCKLDPRAEGIYKSGAALGTANKITSAMLDVFLSLERE